MRTALLATSTAVALAFLAACERESRPSLPPETEVAPVGNMPPLIDPTAMPETVPSPTPEPEPSATPAVTVPSPTPTGTSGTIPYGVPVPGKPGFVTSPFSSAGYVDVRGFPPNTEVKDPYSGRVFLVP